MQSRNCAEMASGRLSQSSQGPFLFPKDAYILISCWNRLAAEIVKSCAICGASNVVILADNVLVEEADKLQNILLYNAQQGDKLHDLVERNVLCISRQCTIKWGSPSDLSSILSQQNGVLVVSPEILPYSDMVAINHLCRKYEHKWILASTHGEFGVAFFDGGSAASQYVYPAPHPPHAEMIREVTRETSLEEDNMYLVHISDLVRFNTCIRPGMLLGLSSRVSACFPLPKSLNQPISESGNVVDPVSIEQEDPFEGLHFPVAQVVSKSSYLIHDPYGVLSSRLSDIRSCFCTPNIITVAHSAFEEFDWLCSSNASPIPHTVVMCGSQLQEELHTYAAFIRHLLKTDEAATLSTNQSTLHRLLHRSHSSFAPTITAIASIVSCELLKYANHAGMPISQWFCFDVTPLLGIDPPNPDCPPPAVPALIDYPSLAKARISVSGTGPIAEEAIKTMAFLGIGTFGSFTIFDEKKKHHRPCPALSTSETRGLSQFTEKLVPMAKVRAYHLALDATGPAVNCASLWRQDLHLSCAGSINQRVFADAQAKTFITPVVDGGVDGLWLGSVQTIVPRLTAPYNASQTYSRNICIPHSSHSFPQGHHTIVIWAERKIQSLFFSQPNDCNESIRNILDDLNGSFVSSSMSHLYHRLVEVTSLQECVQWALNFLHSALSHEHTNILDRFGLDTIQSNGELFWKPPRVPPHPLSVDLRDPFVKFVLIRFAVLHAVNNRILPIEDPTEDAISHFVDFLGADILLMAQKIVPQTFTQWLASTAPASQEAIVRGIIHSTNGPSSLESTPIPFLMEDSSDFYLNLLHALSNLRSRNYDFGEIPLDFVSSLVCDPIPHRPSTAYTAALMVIESIKILMCNGRYPVDLANGPKDHFFGLECDAFHSSSSLPAAELEWRGASYTDWDAIHLHVSHSFTFGQLQLLMAQKYGVVLTFIASEVNMLYSTVIPTLAKRRDLPIPSVYRMVFRGAVRTPFVELCVGCDTIDGDEVPDFPKLFLHWIPQN